MIKVLIVDDEFYSREGMKQTIPWKDLGCEICGECENAIEALDSSKILTPDIVITDIRMPGLDGLSMCKEIKTFLPKCKFIIITGYDDFQYARTAVKMQALDFLLKPIDENELIDAIKKAKAEILEDKTLTSLSSEKMLINIMRGQSNLENIYGFFKKDSIIKIILIQNHSYEHFSSTGQDSVNYKINSFICNYFKNKYTNFTVYVLDPHVNRQAIVLDSRCLEFVESLDEIRTTIYNEFRGILTISISSDDKIENIINIYNESKALLEESFYEGTESTILPHTIEGKVFKADWIILHIKNITTSFKSHDKESLKRNIDTLYMNMKNARIDSSIVIKSSLELFLEIKNILLSYGIDSSMLYDLNFEKLDLSLYEIKNMMRDYIFSSLDTIREFNGRLEENTIEKAILFINENFDKNICLTSVAKEVFLNESYLSRALKKTLGMGFAEYIRKLKIEESIVLLNKGLSIGDIALKIGYTDYRSFSSNFKKYTGYSPKSYIKK